MEKRSEWGNGIIQIFHVYTINLYYKNLSDLKYYNFVYRINYKFFEDSIKDFIENLQPLAKQKLIEKRTEGLLA